jgi:hypothetical protein
MTEHETNRHLDELLDSALSAYSAVEPGPGLETRILANLREAESRKATRAWSFQWMWTGAAVLAAVLVLVVARISHKPVASSGNTIAHTQPASAETPARQKLPGSEKGARHRPQRHAAGQVENAALPLNQRPSVFPSPSPLSEQEKLLLSYYARTPREELVAQSHPDEPPAISDSDGDIALPDLVSVPQRSSNTR